MKFTIAIVSLLASQIYLNFNSCPSVRGHRIYETDGQTITLDNLILFSRRHLFASVFSVSPKKRTGQLRQFDSASSPSSNYHIFSKGVLRTNRQPYTNKIPL